MITRPHSSSAISSRSMCGSQCLRGWRQRRGLLLSLLFIFSVPMSTSHPWCVPDGTPTIPQPSLSYCSNYNDWPGSCCSANSEQRIAKNVVEALISASAEPQCHKHVKEVYCAFCSPLAAHKFDSETGMTPNPTTWLCPRFCGRFYDACSKVEIDTNAPARLGQPLRIPGLRAGLGKVKISDFYETKFDFCSNFSTSNVGACHTDNPAELNEDQSQMPGVPYKVELAYPHLDLNTIPRKNPLDRAHIVDMIPYGDGTDRVVVSFQTGIVALFENSRDVTTYTVFLDLRNKVAYDDPSEIGFLGLAFHPDYAQNGYIYAKYTPQANLDFISRFTKSPEGDFIDPASEVVILSLAKEDIMHHGGAPIFGRDRMLWIATGDGVHFSKCYRAENPSPDLGSLLGKMLRIDVDGEQNGLKYRIPVDNPFYGNNRGIRQEIYSYGLRNPWKFTIDPPTNQVWLGDVGYALWEEIDILQQGKDYGWHGREGTHCFYPKAETCPMKPDEVLPIFEYPHTMEQCKTTPCVYGRCVVGGYVYRGTRVPSLSGVYLFAEYDVGTFWMLTPDPQNPWKNNVQRLAPQFAEGKYNRTLRAATFGIDLNSEIYLTNWEWPDIWRFARELAPPPIPAPTSTNWSNSPLWGDEPTGAGEIPESSPLEMTPLFTTPPTEAFEPFGASPLPQSEPPTAPRSPTSASAHIFPTRGVFWLVVGVALIFSLLLCTQ